jgi:hypothetical protein
MGIGDDVRPGGRRVTRIRRFYGAQPLHLLATIVSFAIVGAGVAGWFQAGSDPRGVLLWALGSVVAFEWILLPLAWLLDRIALGSWSQGPSPRPRLGPRNRAYVRVPTLLSALLLLVFAPLIFRADTPDFEATTGITPPDYLARWLLATAAMFVISAFTYALSLRRARGGDHRPEADLSGID